MAEEWTRWDRQRLLWTTPGLRAREMRVLAYMLDAQGGDKSCYPSAAAVGEALGIAPNNIRSEWSSLRSRGLLQRVGSRGKRHQIVEWSVCPRPLGASEPMRIAPDAHQDQCGGGIGTDAGGASNPMRGGHRDRCTDPISYPRTDPRKEKTDGASAPKPLDILVQAVWADFNLARSSPKAGLRDLGEISPARMAAGRTKLKPLLKAHGHDGALEIARNAMRHQFTDEHARQYPTWETLVRHLEDWSDRWESGRSKPSDPREVGQAWLDRRRAAAGSQA